MYFITNIKSEFSGNFILTSFAYIIKKLSKFMDANKEGQFPSEISPIKVSNRK